MSLTDSCRPRWGLFPEAREVRWGLRAMLPQPCSAINMDFALAEAGQTWQVCGRMFCWGAGCYDGYSTWALVGLPPQHSPAIWSLGHWEIADNLDENGWKIAVFRPLIPAPLFFSYFLFHFFPLPPAYHKITLEAEEPQARPVRFFSPSLWCVL